jgi:hypothetical protein
VSEGNTREQQVRAGRGYVRAQLAATAHGLSMQPLSQALQEYAEQESPYAAIHALLQAARPAQTVQMWARPRPRTRDRAGAAPRPAGAPGAGVEDG